MTSIISLIGAVLQVVFLILKNKFEKDEAVRKQKEAMRAETEDAIKSRDLSRINSCIDKLRK